MMMDKRSPESSLDDKAVVIDKDRMREMTAKSNPSIFSYWDSMAEEIVEGGVKGKHIAWNRCGKLDPLTGKAYEDPSPVGALTSR